LFGVTRPVPKVEFNGGKLGPPDAMK